VLTTANATEINCLACPLKHEGAQDNIFLVFDHPSDDRLTLLSICDRAPRALSAELSSSSYRTFRVKPNERNFMSCESRILVTHSLRLNSFCVVVWYKLHFYMKPNAAEITGQKFCDSNLIKLRSFGFTLTG
jgi:hypothetical protein